MGFPCVEKRQGKVMEARRCVVCDDLLAVNLVAHPVGRAKFLCKVLGHQRD